MIKNVKILLGNNCYNSLENTFIQLTTPVYHEKSLTNFVFVDFGFDMDLVLSLGFGFGFGLEQVF